MIVRDCFRDTSAANVTLAFKQLTSMPRTRALNDTNCRANDVIVLTAGKGAAHLQN